MSNYLQKKINSLQFVIKYFSKHRDSWHKGNTVTAHQQALFGLCESHLQWHSSAHQQAARCPQSPFVQVAQQTNTKTPAAFGVLPFSPPLAREKVIKSGLQALLGSCVQEYKQHEVRLRTHYTLTVAQDSPECCPHLPHSGDVACGKLSGPCSTDTNGLVFGMLDFFSIRGTGEDKENY